MDSGKLAAVIGSSRSGKTQWVRKQIRKAPAVLIWDIKGEYRDFARVIVTNKADLVAALRRYAGTPARIAYVGAVEDFDFFCRCAQTWVKSHAVKRQRSVLVFEETADVTSPGKAPPAYGIILRRFLSMGVDIYAITQRPAESDKTAVGNASILHVCRLNLDKDRRSAASNTGIPLADIEALEADQDAGRFGYLSADTGRRKYRAGRLIFRAGKPVFTDTGPELSL